MTLRHTSLRFGATSGKGFYLGWMIEGMGVTHFLVEVEVVDSGDSFLATTTQSYEHYCPSIIWVLEVMDVSLRCHD